MGTNYHPARLVQIPSKGNKWFVVVTKPNELKSGSKNLQVRRSTGTTDKRRAESAMVRIAGKIYDEFDVEIDEQAKQAQPVTFTFIDPTKATDARTRSMLNDPFVGRRMLPPLEPSKAPNTKLSRFIPDFIAHLEDIAKGGHKERKTKLSKLSEFHSLVGDLYVADIRKSHAYDYAKWMATEGRANKTIKSNVSRVSAMLIWAEQRGVLETNPFVNLHLADYGRKSLSWLPFDYDELVQIFAQNMPEMDRLALSLLATTGARLDEIALLEWEQVKLEYGITYLDLEHAPVKNEQSRRVIPIHSRVVPLLKNRQVGRLFDYPLDRDRKAQNAAGKCLAPYIDNITSHPQKVLHSFRGTYKDLLRNAGLTEGLADKLENGELSLDDISKILDEKRVPKELNDRITGHAQIDIAGKYGLGHTLIPRAAVVERLDLRFIPAAAVT